jgi:hypothetical protein
VRNLSNIFNSSGFFQSCIRCMTRIKSLIR